MDNDVDRALDRLGKLEAETAGATERKLAAEHRKILHELRRDWLTTVCKSVMVALVTVVASLALIAERKSERDTLEGNDRSERGQH